MLKSSSTHDQLSNVIYKNQNRYQHHHYYHNDLNYRCNRKSKQNKRHKRRKRNRNRRSKKKTKTAKHINNRINSIIKDQNSCNSKNNNISNICNITTINNANKVCYCANYTECCKVNLNISYQINGFLKHVCVYFEKKFNNLQLVLVVILLALITCTAQSIDNQIKPQQKPTTSPKLLPALNAAASMATINFSESLHASTCHHNNLNVKAEANIKFQTPICHNLRHRYHRYLKGQRRLKLNNHKNFKNLTSYNKSSSQWLTNNMHKKLKTNLNNQQSAMQSHCQHVNKNNDDDDHHHHHHHPNDSAIEINKAQQSYKNNKNEIKIDNEMAKEDEQRRAINNSNISKFFQHILTNKYKSNSYKPNYNYNKKTNVVKRKVENANDDIVIIDHIDKYKIDHQYNDDVHDSDNNDHAETKNFETSINFLPNANHSLQFIRNQQHIDNIKLMKLVMDGLGLKKLPKMQMVNISQEEYVTKYREYLQRVHTRKRRELQNINGEYDENFLKPLEIFTINSNSTLLSQYQEYQNSYKGSALIRQKRNALETSDDDEKNYYQKHDHDEDNNQSLEERVRNILFLKKKYQKPRSTKEERDERKTNIRLIFALKPEIFNLSSSDIEEANIRLVLIHSPILAIRNFKNKKTHTKSKSNSCGSNKSNGQKNLHQVNVLNLKLFFISKHGKRILLDGRNLDIHVDHTKPDETHTQWLQFDVSKAIKMSLDDNRQHHIVLELQCDNCKRIGARILNDAYDTAAEAIADDPLTEGHQLMPVLNIIGHFDKSQRSMRPHKYENHHSDANEEATTQRHYHHQTYNNNKNRHNRRTNCYKANQRCCRHSMEVTFKEIKGFEFIIQPKVFDAGYCHGRCPPRYNPAHHHALLQSLIWKQNHHKAPRPCCAPSKLVELEVLHVDEKNSEKLKISTWSDMKVVECACS